MMRELVIKFNSIPKFTKIYLVFIVFNSFIYALSRTLKSHYLWFFIELQLLSINKLKNFQFWRFFTNFFFTRHLNFTLPLHLILIIKTFSSLENFYKNKKSYKDFYLMLVFNIMVLNIVGLILENEIMSEEFLISILFMEAHTDPERERNLFGMHIKGIVLFKQNIFLTHL